VKCRKIDIQCTYPDLINQILGHSPSHGHGYMLVLVFPSSLAHPLENVEKFSQLAKMTDQLFFIHKSGELDSL